MKIPRSKALALAIGIAAAGTPGLVACGSDWSVGAATQPGEGGAPDGSMDAAAADATTSGDAEADATTTPDAEVDALPESGPSCSALAADVAARGAAAKSCAFPASVGECTNAVQDECGCESYVAADAGASAAYTAAIAAFLDAGCPRSCGDACPSPGAPSCFANADGDGGHCN
jgi:hypothetical protein